MTPARSDPAQQDPPDATTLRHTLPRVAISGNLFREHQLRWDAQDGGCWWFSSSGDGRFDLEDPLGTCYLGETEGVAARERCGRLMAMRLPITEAIYHERVVSEVLPPSADILMADLADPGAITAGVTGELFASANYAQGKTWAHACWDAGFGGLRYPARFTPGGSERAFAVFGEGGSQPDRGVIHRRSLLEVLQHLGYPTIRSDELTSDTLHVQDEADPGVS